MRHATVAYRYYKRRRPNFMYHAKSVDLSLMINVDKSTSQCDPDCAMAYGGYESHGAVTSSNVQLWHTAIRTYGSQAAYLMANQWSLRS